MKISYKKQKALKISFFYLFLSISTLILPSGFYDACYQVDHGFKSPHSLKKIDHEAKKRFAHVKDLYKYAHKKSQDTSLKIPKIIHQIWLGPKPLPVQHQNYRESWLKHNPTWDYKLWREEDLLNFAFINKKAFNLATNYGEKSDILRYEILYKFGGLYADDDFECLSSFDQLHNTYTFYAGLEPVGDFSISNALMASAPGNQFLLYCLQHIEHDKNFKNGIKQILARTGPTYFTHCIFDNFDYIARSGGIIFPTNYFFSVPFQSRNKSDAHKLKLVTKESMAIHHWGGMWKEKK